MTVWYRPISPILLNVDGVERVYSTDEVFTDEEPAVYRYPSAFIALSEFHANLTAANDGMIDSGGVEQATAAPGEKRRRV